MNEDYQFEFKLPFYEQMKQNFQKTVEEDQVQVPMRPREKSSARKKSPAIKFLEDQVARQMDEDIQKAREAYLGTPILEVNKPEAVIAPLDKTLAPVRAINNYINRAKYKLSHNEPLGGEYILPAIGLTALGAGAFASAPVTSTLSTVGGTIGNNITDRLSRLITGNTWAQNISNLTGLVPEAAQMTNPGMLAGGATPFMTRGSRTLLSAADQIVKDAAKDVVQYGPISVAKNPRGWVRPYVDQVKNGLQGWRDMRLAQRNGAIQTDVNQPYFESFAKKSGKFDGSYPVGDNKMAEFYDYPEYNEGIGDGIYSRFKRDDTPLFGVTQEKEMPNTYLFHVGGGGNRGFQLSGEHQMTLGRMRASVPKYSYIGETKTPSSGQIGMTFVSQNGRTPTFGELIKASKMSVTREHPLSANSTNMLLSGKNGQLRYTNEYMSNFNDQSLAGSNNVTRELIDNPNLSIINNFFQQSNPDARRAFVGLDGKLKMPIPINFKIK